METPNFRERESKPSYLKLSPKLQKTIQDFSQQRNLEKQKQSQKENLHNKTNTSLQKLANVIYVEFDGQEMTLEEFNKKYPDFFKKKRQEQTKKDLQKTTGNMASFDAITAWQEESDSSAINLQQNVSSTSANKAPKKQKTHRADMFWTVETQDELKKRIQDSKRKKKVYKAYPLYDINGLPLETASGHRNLSTYAQHKVQAEKLMSNLDSLPEGLQVQINYANSLEQNNYPSTSLYSSQKKKSKNSPKTPSLEEKRQILFPDNSPSLRAQQRRDDRFKGYFTIKDEVTANVARHSNTIKNLSHSDINRIAEAQARAENGGFMNIRREMELKRQLEKQQRDARWGSSFDQGRKIQEEINRRQQDKWKF